MAVPTTSYIAIGGATVSIGNWVANKGASTLTDVGHTKAPTAMNVSYEDYAINSEQSFGPLRKIPISATIKLKVPMLQSDGLNLRYALRQASTQLSGATPTETLLVGAMTEQYHRITIVTRGIAAAGGSPGTRTVTVWRCIVDGLDEIPYGKSGEQALVLSLHVLYDDTVSTTDKFLNIVDS
jgi:hypothetical protein